MARKLEPQKSKSTKLKKIREDAERGVEVICSLSGKEIEAMKKENIAGNKARIKAFRVYSMPSLSPIFASKEELEERIIRFLKRWDGVDLSKAIPPTLNQLATAIGYTTSGAMLKYISDHPDEEMSNAMLYAIGQVKDISTQKKFILGSKRMDWKAFDSENERIDSEIAGASHKEKKLSVKDVEEQRKHEENDKLTREEIARRLADLSKAVYDDGVNPIIEDAEYSEIEAPVALEETKVV